MDEPLPHRARRASPAFKDHWSGDTLNPDYIHQLLEQGESPGGPSNFFSPDHEKGGEVCVIVANAADPRERLDYLQRALMWILHGTSNYIYYREIIDAILGECSDDDIRAMEDLWAMTLFNCDLPFHQEELRYLLFHPRVFESIDPDIPLLDPRYFGIKTLREALKYTRYSTIIYESFILAKDQTNEAKRARVRLDLYREELMQVTWHPARLVAWCVPDFYESIEMKTHPRSVS